jgi:hypothetical protein
MRADVADRSPAESWHIQHLGGHFTRDFISGEPGQAPLLRR